MNVFGTVIFLLMIVGFVLQAGLESLSGRGRACARLLEIGCVGAEFVLLGQLTTSLSVYWQIAAYVLLAYAAYFTGILLPGYVPARVRQAVGNALRGPLKVLSVLSFFTRPKTAEADQLSSEEIREMLEEMPQDVVDAPQKELISNVFDMDETSVDEICTHRSQVVSLSLSEPMDMWEKIIHDNRHTFYPLLGKTEDDVMGILDTRDFFRLDHVSRDSVLRECVDSPFFVAENMKADDLFREMQARKTYFAVVLDEYGGMTGIVTLHDVVETLFGRMREADEEDVPQEIRRLPDGSWEIYGAASLEDVGQALKLDLPLDSYDTFGGYVLGEYGFIPEDGTQLEVHLDPLRIQIFDIHHHRIGRMRVEKKSRQVQD